MTQVTISSRMPSLPLKNVDSEIDLDNLIKNLNNVLGNYLEIFNCKYNIHIYFCLIIWYYYDNGLHYFHLILKYFHLFSCYCILLSYTTS